MDWVPTGSGAISVINKEPHVRWPWLMEWTREDVLRKALCAMDVPRLLEVRPGEAGEAANALKDARLLRGGSTAGPVLAERAVAMLKEMPVALTANRCPWRGDAEAPAVFSTGAALMLQELCKLLCRCSCERGTPADVCIHACMEKVLSASSRCANSMQRKWKYSGMSHDIDTHTAPPPCRLSASSQSNQGCSSCWSWAAPAMDTWLEQYCSVGLAAGSLQSALQGTLRSSSAHDSSLSVIGVRSW